MSTPSRSLQLGLILAVSLHAFDELVIAIADPRRMADIEAIIQRPVEFVASPESAVLQRIEVMYADDKGRLGETLLINKKLKRIMADAGYKSKKRKRRKKKKK